MFNNIANLAKHLILHLTFWIGVWFFFVYFFSYNSNDTYYITWFSSLLLPIAISTTYITIYFLIPKYLLSKRYFKLALYSFYTLVLSVYLTILAIYGSFIFITKLDITKVPPMGKNFVFILILIYLIVGVVSFIYLLKHNFNAQSKYKALENKILEANLQIKEQELYYLKKQIHPHFLFNTLNTIYGFALKKSEHTADIILKLSNLLDYILYQVQKSRVQLKDEIEHINEYIDLEKIRFEDRLKVNFNYSKNIENIEIAPMLLIPFIENAFKHGSIINGFLAIEINLNLTENNKLIFTIKNSFLNNNESETTGIGLDNIRKRLILLFPNKYNLNTEIKENQFIVSLIINEIKSNGENI